MIPIKTLLPALIFYSLLSAAPKQYVDVTGWDTEISYDEALHQFISHSSKLCKSGDSKSCQLVGEHYSVGDPKNKNYHMANTFFTAGCSQNFPISCIHLAFAYENGQGVRQDITEAHELYGKACDLGMQEGCDHFARINRLLKVR